ncbi:MAG: FHA domain protein [Firmicutes bacterium ADurb.Bin182]|nr:MAG: FHA domain protein [Firmicutes bacterium ADurb.Bin182]
MRYIFLMLIAYILFRLVHQSVNEYKAISDAKKSIKGFSPGYLLIFEPEALKGKRVELRKETTIGRSSHCDVMINLKQIAPVHAAIYEKREKVYIYDYGSKSGVYVNNTRIGRKDRLLNSGDCIKIGDAVMSVKLYGEEDPVEQAETY